MRPVDFVGTSQFSEQHGEQFPVPYAGSLPICGSFRQHVMLVLPLPGLIEAEQVGRAGGCVTETVLELHCVVPAGGWARW